MVLGKSHPLSGLFPHGYYEDKELVISKGPLGEVPTLPTAMKSSYTSAAQAWEPTAEGSGPSSFHQQVFQKWMARKQGGRQAKGRGPSTPLWKGSSASSGGRPGGDTEVGRGQCKEQVEAGKGCPQSVLLPASSC